MAKKILIVDDSAFMRKIIKDMLLKGNYTNTVEAGSYKEAVAKFKSEQPELVLLDLILPDKGGMEVLKEIRKTGKATKVIIISAIGQPQSLAEAKKLGVTEYIIKPFEEKKVLATIKLVLG